DRTSPSPAKMSPVMCTVADARLRLSESATAALPANVSGGLPTWYETSVGMLPRTGALFGVMLMVSVTGVLRLLSGEPSLSVQVTVRVGFAPELVGLAPDAKVRLSNTC